MPKIWPLGVGPSKPSRFPPQDFFPETNSQLRPRKNATGDPAHFRIGTLVSSSKRMFENPGGDEKSMLKNAWVTTKKCVKIHSGVQLGVAERLVLRSFNGAFPLWLHTQKTWPKRTLAKLRWERGYAVEGRLAFRFFVGSNLGKHRFVAKKDSTRNQSGWLRVCCWKNGGGFIWGDFVKWQVCVQRWSLVWRQELAVCVRALGNRKARCMPAAMGLWMLRSQGDRRFYTEVKEGADIHPLLCVGERGRGWWYPRTYYDLTWNTSFAFARSSSNLSSMSTGDRSSKLRYHEKGC